MATWNAPPGSVDQLDGNQSLWPQLSCRCVALHQPSSRRRNATPAATSARRLSRLALDGQPTAIFDFFEDTEKLHPVNVAVAKRHFLSGSAGAILAGILGMGMNDAPAQCLNALVGIETV